MEILQKIQKILREHKKELGENYKIRQIGIFGSYARKEQKKTSDIDLLVDFKEVPDLLKFIEIENYLQRLLGRKVDLIRKEAIRPEIRKTVLKDVILA